MPRHAKLRALSGHCLPWGRRRNWREADIVSSMSIGAVGIRLATERGASGRCFGCRANANRRLKLNNTAAKLGEKLSAAQVNLVGAGKLEVVGPARR